MNKEFVDDNCTTVAELRRQVIAFRDARDWKQFHNPKDLAIAMSIEAAEVLELCRFKSSEEIIESVKSGKNKEFAYEMADVFSYLLTLSDCLGIDLAQAMREKAEINAIHYPVNLAKGKKAKYTELI
ncbi:MAG: nucleotide pyrophosphohydrolase [Candidatus Bruticola sp.]